MENKYTVLIVEDNPEARKLSTFILESNGYTVFGGSNAGEALSILDKSGESFDAVLLDYDLPDITGGTLGGWIRSKFPDIAILIVTGYGRLPAIVKQTYNIQATLITKPIVEEELIAAIEATIENRKLKRKIKRDATVNTETIRHILSLGANPKGLSN